MKKLVPIVLVVVMGLSACNTMQKSLYSWSNYNVTSYNYLKNKDEKSASELIKTYELIIAKQKGSREVVPPGIYADYGYMLIQSGKTEEGVKMMKMEVSLYPESAKFVSNILKTVEK